jgi:hypothetical protein
MLPAHISTLSTAAINSRRMTLVPQVTDLIYEAIEPKRQVLRLAHDKNGNVFIMTNHDNPFTAPYVMASLGLMRTTNRGLETYEPDEDEMRWIGRMQAFANALTYEEA